MPAEQALEPDLPICDAHHHLWDHGPADRYLLEDALRDFGSGHNVVSTVFVDSDHAYRNAGPAELRSVGETEFANAIAASPGHTQVAAAIVGRVDLALGSRVAQVLETHLAASPGHFRGVRHWLNSDPHAEAAGIRSGAPPGLARDARFREGFAQLARYGLVFDAWLYFTQLPDLVELARACPEVTIALNHAGGLLGAGPYARREAHFAAWKRSMSELAACPNVTVKLGGFCSPRAGFDWHRRAEAPSSSELAEALSPYCLHSIEAFGPQRCMFESNFPPDRAGCSYVVLWNAFKRMTRAFSADERQSLFHGTAARVYRIAGGRPGGASL